MKYFIFFTFLFTLFCQAVLCQNKSLVQNSNTSLAYIENKGQVCDQNHRPRADVLFSATDGNLICHFKNNSISYQLSRIDSWKEQDKNIAALNKQDKKIPDQITIYRLDINWKNANTDVYLKKGLANTSYDNYYLQQCPEGVLNVKSYEDFTYQNMYDGIDLKWYQKDGHLKYDYLVSAGANYKKIQLDFKGAQKIIISKNGDLVITTPLGDIIEQTPIVKQNGKILKAKWVLKNNIVSYEIENINPNQGFVIDPLVRTWGTYYGVSGIGSGIGSGGSYNSSSANDSIGNIYIAGTCNASMSIGIATSGSYQSSFSGTFDAYLAKFDSLGSRQWGTYYGGYNYTSANECEIDLNNNNNIYLIGETNSSTGIATSTSFQPIYGGGVSDGFIAKFDNAGLRQWATYYGGPQDDRLSSCVTDIFGNLYFTGATTSTVDISTLASHQSINGGNSDAFVVKFSNAGLRQWATYYGGTENDLGESCSIDGFGNLYVSGYTNSSNGNSIATIGCHQPVYVTFFDMLHTDIFLVKFNNFGVRLWGTYYGGEFDEGGSSCSCDAAGNIYLSGGTTSSNANAIATIGSHQPVLGGSSDAFLAKFDSTGVRQWGTYYGDVGLEHSYFSKTDLQGNIFLIGETNLSTGTVIATNGCYKTAISGSPYKTDAFLVKFNSLGNRIWGTYYGGTEDDIANSCTIYNNFIYLAGSTQSSGGTDIATVGSLQPHLGAEENGFLVQFYDCTISSPPANTTIPTNQTICANETTTLSVSGTALTHWYNNSGGLSIGTGLSFTTPTLSAGTYTYYADASDCPISINSTAITVTVNALPTITVNSGTICSGDSFTITPTGAYSYTYSNGSVVTPTVSNTYTVIGESIEGCIENSGSISTVSVTQIPTVAITGNTITCASNSLILNATGVGSILWNTGETTPSITTTPTNNITYIATASNNCGNAVDSISIFVNPLPVVIVSNDTTILIDNSINLFANGSSDATYSWLPSSIACSTCSTNIVAPINTTTYTVTVTNANGCSVIKNIVVTVESNFDVFVPDIFSPNGDGQNDILYVRGKGIKELSFKLYDRLGEKIFETNDVTKGWDGSYKGAVLNNAVFVYVLTATLIDGSKINKHGDVTLIR